MSKRQDIEIIRRWRKVSFKEARKIYKANKENLIESLMPYPPRVVSVTPYTPITLRASKCFPEYIANNIPHEEIRKEMARAMLPKIAELIIIDEHHHGWQSYDKAVIYDASLRVILEV